MLSRESSPRSFEERLLPQDEEQHVRPIDPRSSAPRRCVTLDGPSPPKKSHVTLWLPKFQQFPLVLHKRLSCGARSVVLVIGLLLWACCFLYLINHSVLAHPVINGDTNVAMLECGRNTEVWVGPNEMCGVDARWCSRPAGGELKFKCPANCVRESWSYRPYPVGKDVVYHSPLVVGSNGVYRSDSFVCAAALHRGIISNTWGGGGIIRYLGSQKSYSGEPGNNSIVSMPFDTEFVESYEFVRPEDEHVEVSGCQDLRLLVAILNLIAVLVFGYFVTSPIVFLYIVVTIGFWTVIFGTNPPWTGGDAEENAEIVSRSVQRFLPCLLGTYAVWKLAAEPQLKGMNAYLSRSLLWAGPFFCGICENYVFGAIPVDRLTVDDLNEQPGAWLSILIIGLAVMAIAVGQAYVIWSEGKLRLYLTGYGLVSATLFAISWLPNQTLRIHHFILALILLPGTALQTTPSLIYQGLLTGLYVAGVSRWGFASILETPSLLARGGPVDPAEVALLTPQISNSTMEGIKNVILNWSGPNLNGSSIWDGVSLVINDVERVRTHQMSFNLTHWVLESFTPPYPLEYYVRAASTVLQGTETGSYTLAGVMELDTGKWTPPHPGIV